MKRFFSLSCLLLAACSVATAQAPWQHSGPVGPLQLERDRADCQMYLDAAQQDSTTSPPHRAVHEWDREFIDCMAERGWQPR